MSLTVYGAVSLSLRSSRLSSCNKFKPIAVWLVHHCARHDAGTRVTKVTETALPQGPLTQSQSFSDCAQQVITETLYSGPDISRFY